MRAAIALFEEQGYEKTTVQQIAAAADVDPKTFNNYFRGKDDVLFTDVEQDFDRLLEPIAKRRAGEGPGEALARMIEEFRAHRRAKVPEREPGELSAAVRLAMSSPALQAKGLYLLVELQRRIAGELVRAFPTLDPITAGAMVGALMGAIQQAGLTSVRLGRSQDELWEATRHGAEIAMNGLLAVRPDTDADLGSDAGRDVDSDADSGPGPGPGPTARTGEGTGE